MADHSLDEEIEIVCTNCRYRFQKRVRYLETHTDVFCPACGKFFPIDVDVLKGPPHPNPGSASNSGWGP